MIKKTISAGLAASALLLSACGAGVDANSRAEGTVPTQNIPELDDAVTSGESDPRPPAELDKPSSGAALGVSEEEMNALVSDTEKKQKEAPEAFKDVDFLNFTHEIDDFARLKFEAKDGEFFDEEERLFFSVTDIQYGDIGGDESPEAVVYVFYNTGGTGQFTDALIYGIDSSGEPAQIAAAGSGDRGFGGIESGEVQDGNLLLTRFQGQAACCPMVVVSSQYRDWNDGQLQLVGEPEKEAFVSFDAPENVESYESDPGELKFLPGTSSARIFGSGDSEPLKFVASKGQKAKLTLFSELYGEVNLQLKGSKSGEVFGEIAVGESVRVTLPNDGEYVIAPTVVSAELANFSPGFQARIEID